MNKTRHSEQKPNTTTIFNMRNNGKRTIAPYVRSVASSLKRVNAFEMSTHSNIQQHLFKQICNVALYPTIEMMPLFMFKFFMSFICFGE